MGDNAGVKIVTDRAAVLIPCLILLFFGDMAAGVVALLVSITASGITHAFEERPHIWLLLACVTVGIAFDFSAMCALPLVAHDLIRLIAFQRAPVGAAVVLGLPVIAHGRFLLSDPALVNSPALGGRYFLLVAVSALTGLLALRASQTERIQGELYTVHDDLQEKMHDLRDANAGLLAAQEHEGDAIILAERARIARDIHDGVGHRLTGLLFRVRALQVIHRDDGDVVGELEELAGGLEESLDSMRSSVHALSDEGQDLATLLNVLGNHSALKQVHVNCSVESVPPPEVRRTILAVVKEALTNAARHGDARTAHVNVVEHPAFWQLTISNDGLPGPDHIERKSSGLGLSSMTDRIEGLGGKIRITSRPAFSIFATIPKGLS